MTYFVNPVATRRFVFHLLTWLFIGGLALATIGCNSEPAEPNQEPVKLDPSAVERQAELLSKMKSTPHVPGGIYELPSWARDVPFDIKSKFEIPAEKNREQLYLEAFLPIDVSTLQYFPHLAAAEPQVIEFLIEPARDQQMKVSDFVLKQFDEENSSFGPLRADQFLEAKELLAPFEIGLQTLGRVQDRPECFLHSEWELAGGSTSLFAAGDAAYMMVIKGQMAIPDPETIGLINSGLQMSRDFQDLGQLVSQFTCRSIESNMMNNLVRPVLSQENLSVDQLDALISVLLDHARKSQEMDVFLEATKRELLDFRHLFDLLSHQSYATPERVEDFAFEQEVSLVELLLREVVDFAFYRVNEEMVKDSVELMAQSNKQVAAVWESIKDDGGDFEAGARMLVGLFLYSELESLEPGDFSRDIAVLDTRYREVVAACQLDFPDSTNRLQQLEEAWTLDKSWEKTKLLRWFKPLTRLAKTRRRRLLNQNAWICLAAVRKWQLEHEGKLPSALGPALEAIDAEFAILDPYSGKPLRLLDRENETGVYSVGPDLDDDQAKIEFDPNRGYRGGSTEVLDGDVIFLIPKY